VNNYVKCNFLSSKTLNDEIFDFLKSIKNNEIEMNKLIKRVK